MFCNLLGNEAGRMIYDGDILVAQHGKMLAQNNRLSFKPVDMLMCDVDFDNESNSQQQPLTDSKDPNEELTKAVTLGLFDYLRKSKSKVMLYHSVAELTPLPALLWLLKW